MLLEIGAVTGMCHFSMESNAKKEMQITQHKISNALVDYVQKIIVKVINIYCYNYFIKHNTRM